MNNPKQNSRYNRVALFILNNYFADFELRNAYFISLESPHIKILIVCDKMI